MSIYTPKLLRHGHLTCPADANLASMQHQYALFELHNVTATGGVVALLCCRYWTLEQMVAHHTLGGCNLRTGDLLGTGTLSCNVCPSEICSPSPVPMPAGSTRQPTNKLVS